MGVAGNSSQVLLTIEPALSPHGGYSILTPLLAFPANGPFFSPGSFYTSSSAQPSQTAELARCFDSPLEHQRAFYITSLTHLAKTYKLVLRLSAASLPTRAIVRKHPDPVFL